MSAFMGSGVLALWLDVAPDLERETDDWYVDEHLPDRIDTGGYLRARCVNKSSRALSASVPEPAGLTVFARTCSPSARALIAAGRAAMRARQAWACGNSLASTPWLSGVLIQGQQAMSAIE